jgi:probable rRNA maturation factor
MFDQDSKEFKQIKEAIVGKNYDLSFAYLSPAEMRKLNLIYRNIDKATDILSFPLSETEGEMYICLEEAEAEAKKFDRDLPNFLRFLFIHGLVHLIGHDHGSTMETIEAKFRKEFGV